MGPLRSFPLQRWSPTMPTAEWPFRQNSDFWYLTGLDEPDAVALFLPHRPEGERFVLFVNPKDPPPRSGPAAAGAVKAPSIASAPIVPTHVSVGCLAAAVSGGCRADCLPHRQSSACGAAGAAHLGDAAGPGTAHWPCGLRWWRLVRCCTACACARTPRAGADAGGLQDLRRAHELARARRSPGHE